MVIGNEQLASGVGANASELRSLLEHERFLACVVSNDRSRKPAEPRTDANHVAARVPFAQLQHGSARVKHVLFGASSACSFSLTALCYPRGSCRRLSRRSRSSRSTSSS